MKLALRLLKELDFVHRNIFIISGMIVAKRDVRQVFV